MDKDRLSEARQSTGNCLGSDLHSCCPVCGGDLVEFQHGNYFIVECARACGWWDEQRTVKERDGAASGDNSTNNEDRLAAAIRWAEIKAPHCRDLRRA